jgi:hypothetical protein
VALPAVRLGSTRRSADRAPDRDDARGGGPGGELLAFAAAAGSELDDAVASARERQAIVPSEGAKAARARSAFGQGARNPVRRGQATTGTVACPAALAGVAGPAIFLLLSAGSLALMLFWAWRLARLDEPSLGRWLVKLADIAAFLLFMVLAARWDILGIHTRTAVLALVAVAGLASLRRHAGRPGRAPERWSGAERWSVLASLALMLGLAGATVAGLVPPRGAYPLACPLAGGRFIVGQGGSNRLLNHHAGHRAQSYAADILGLGPAGWRAGGLLPRDLDDYAIYGAAVVSPCDGRVADLRDGLPDGTPPRGDKDNPAGNHVTLSCGPIEVELAHLAPGTIAVAPGQPVAAGDPLGRVGNSGNSTEPHLHIHAVDAATGEAVPIRLGGTLPVRNRLLDCG